MGHERDAARGLDAERVDAAAAGRHRREVEREPAGSVDADRVAGTRGAERLGGDGLGVAAFPQREAQTRIGTVFIRAMTAISATIFLVSINWTLITVRILENMTEVALGPAAAFSVFVIVVVLAVTSLLNVALSRMTAPTQRVAVGTAS